MGADLSFSVEMTGECGEEGASPTPTFPPDPGGGIVLGSSTGGGQVLGTKLAPTGVWRERALWIVMGIGALMIFSSIYVWERSKNSARVVASRRNSSS